MEQNLPAVLGPVEPKVRPVAWAMRIPGCDGSADWVELGEVQPAPSAPAVASPLYDKDGLERAVAAERERCAHEVDVALGHALEDGCSVESVQAIMGVRDMLRATAEMLCMCKERLASNCPGEWEPGCDLGSNPVFVRVADDPGRPNVKLSGPGGVRSNDGLGP